MISWLSLKFGVVKPTIGSSSLWMRILLYLFLTAFSRDKTMNMKIEKISPDQIKAVKKTKINCKNSGINCEEKIISWFSFGFGVVLGWSHPWRRILLKSVQLKTIQI